MIDQQGDNLVFLLSLPRSGSTMLGLMLGSHPEICCPPEPWIVLALAEYLELGEVRRAPYGRGWAEFAAFEFLLNAERKERGVLSRTLQRIGRNISGDRMAAARQILRSLYGLHLQLEGKKVFVDKTPRYLTMPGILNELFPRAKKILLLRNPLDIFASYSASWNVSRDIFLQNGVSEHTRDFCECLFTLAEYITTAQDDILVLRYEDIVNSPAEGLRKICDFTGLTFSPDMMAYGDNSELIDAYRRSPVGDPIGPAGPKPITPQAANAWEQRLVRDDIQALVNVVGVEIFERLGYVDVLARLKELAYNLPTEGQASENRTMLMRTLMDRVQEPPFSSWDYFTAPSLQYREEKRLERQLNALNDHLEQILSSNSWRLTKPFRWIRRKLSFKLPLS